MQSRNAIITAAYDAGPDYVLQLLRSFRRVNSVDRLIILCTSRAQLAAVAKQYDAELSLPPIGVRYIPIIKMFGAKNRVRAFELLSRSSRLGARCASGLPDSLIQAFLPFPMARLFHARSILSTQEFSHVLLSDARDVVFQTDPFAEPLNLEFAAEDACFGESPFNDKWIQQSFGSDELTQLSGKRIFCSGTIFGSCSRIREHLDSMCKCVRRLQSWKSGGQDQAIHNYIIHNMLQESEFAVSTNRRGRIVTLGTSRSPEVVDGCIVDEDGCPFPIVHQYDRLSPEIHGSLNATQ